MTAQEAGLVRTVLVIAELQLNAGKVEGREFAGAREGAVRVEVGCCIVLAELLGEPKKINKAQLQKQTSQNYRWHGMKETNFSTVRTVPTIITGMAICIPICKAQVTVRRRRNQVSLKRCK